MNQVKLFQYYLLTYEKIVMKLNLFKNYFLILALMEN